MSDSAVTKKDPTWSVCCDVMVLTVFARLHDTSLRVLLLTRDCAAAQRFVYGWYSDVPNELVQDHSCVAEGVGAATVPHGRSTMVASARASGASRHISPELLKAGLFVMMGTAGSVLEPHVPPNQDDAVPMYAPLQHIPHPAYPLKVHDPPDRGTAYTVLSNPEL